MLVIGGVGSLWGAVVGALLISFADTVLGNAENGLGLGGLTITIPNGSSLVILGALMTLVSSCARTALPAAASCPCAVAARRRRRPEPAERAAGRGEPGDPRRPVGRPA